MAAFTCRLPSNPLMGLQHSTCFSYRQANIQWRWNARDKMSMRCSWCSPSAVISFMMKPEWDFVSKTSEATKRSLFCWKENKCSIMFIFSANTPSHPFPLSFPIPSFQSFSTIKHFSRWFRFNNTRSWWGHSWRANTGSSICLWMGNNYPIPPDTSSWQKREGAQSHQKE